VIYSESTSGNSNESKNLAHYMCGLLSSTGHAIVNMIAMQPEGEETSQAAPHLNSGRRLCYLPPGSRGKPIEVPGSDVTYGHWSLIEECDLLVITVNTYDTKRCCSKLSNMAPLQKNMAIFSLQRGVRNSTWVKDELSAKENVTVIEAAIGFAVVLDPKYSAFTPTIRHPAIVFERLTKDMINVADGPLSLLEHMNVTVHFRKNLTPIQWGTLVHENLYALNILTKGSLGDTLAKREWRLILALMTRESYRILSSAARGGGWKPELLLVSSFLTPWMVEMILALPTPLFSLLFYLFGLLPESNRLMSPGQLDLTEGRRSMTKWHTAELLETAKRNKYSCDVLEMVVQKIRSLEEGGVGGQQTYNSTADHTTEIIAVIAAQVRKTGHATVRELMFWLSRVAAGVSILVLVVFLLAY
jgi:ketopantoate reductase